MEIYDVVSSLVPAGIFTVKDQGWRHGQEIQIRDKEGNVWDATVSRYGRVPANCVLVDAREGH